MKPSIIIDINIPFIKGLLDEVAHTEYLTAQEMTDDSVKHADALIVRTRTHCNAGLLHGSNVRFIATATIGFDHIDTKYCRNHGIVWQNAPGCNANSVAQYLGSAMSYWATKEGRALKGLTLGIVGVGHVGKAIEQLANQLGMRVLRNDPPRAEQEGEVGFVPLAELCEHADVITFHTPLTVIGDHPTFYLANNGFFQQLKKQPLIINAARGGVVEEAALMQAYDEGIISDYILDCWENEPNINHALMQRALIATPHIAGYSADGKANATEQSVNAVNNFFDLGLGQIKLSTLSPKQQQNATAETLPSLLLQSYAIEEDSERLKGSPETFELQRSNYPVRREVLWVME